MRGRVTITVNIPESLVDQVIPAGEDPARAALEAIALEGYRTDRLSEYAVRVLLGYESRLEVHRFLKEHGAFLRYTTEDLDHDREVAAESARRARD